MLQHDCGWGGPYALRQETDAIVGRNSGKYYCRSKHSVERTDKRLSANGSGNNRNLRA